MKVVLDQDVLHYYHQIFLGFGKVIDYDSFFIVISVSLAINLNMWNIRVGIF